MSVDDNPRSRASLALPRGPHRLTREQVARSQRERLMTAFTELLAARGYAAVTIRTLASRARVSPAAFYEHFADKEACLLAAYDRFAASVAAAITTHVDADAPWGAFIDATVGGYLKALARDPTAARAFIVEMDAAGPAARRRRRDAIHAFAALIAQRHAAIRARDPTLGPLPGTAYLALALGVRELAHDALETDPVPALEGLAPQIRLLMTAVVQGAAAATHHSLRP
jgi:AcrR family transcriptional regulator